MEVSKTKFIKIYYTNDQVHSKCYIWLKENRVNNALVGSANFSMSELMIPNKEVLTSVNETNYKELIEYLDFIRNNSLEIGEFDKKFNLLKRMILLKTKNISLTR